VAKAVRSLRIVHVNATANGGGVAEILRSLVPLLQGLGVETDWFVIEAEEDFFKVTKTLHNQLQGEHGEFTQESIDLYWRTSGLVYEEMCRCQADLWMVHDPQP